MSAFHALRAARAARISIRVDGDCLDLYAEHEPPEKLLQLLHHHKPELLRLLRPSLEGWSTDDWQAFFDERAAICEFDGGLPRAEAEASAFTYCVAEWLNRNPAPSLPWRCTACGGGECSADPLLPFGTELSGHAWLHRGCWPTWSRLREQHAIAVVAEMGIVIRAELETANLGETIA